MFRSRVNLALKVFLRWRLYIGYGLPRFTLAPQRSSLHGISRIRWSYRGRAEPHIAVAV